MVCIYCGQKTKVTNSRSSTKSKQTWRRRECLECQNIFTTREEIDLATVLMVQKAQPSNQTNFLEPFQRDKLFLSLFTSLSHRKTALTDATALTETIITKLFGLQANCVLDITDIKQATAAVLKRFDRAAATYYMAHHSN